MADKEIMNSLSEEVKRKLAECRTAEEAKKVLSEAGVEPLDDELLDEVAGGIYVPSTLPLYGGYSPDSTRPSGGSPSISPTIK